MTKRYEPTWESVKTHTLPQWFDDCKLGIFIHWGLYSVPAWAEVTWELGGEPSPLEWFTHCPYAEWYQNTIRIEGSPAQRHHAETYGADFDYADFADRFTCENWDPAAWAALFREAGAGYVVLTTKHHDGFCLYPSKYTDFNCLNRGPKRDLTGELAEAVRAAGLRMGTYFSGLYDWTTHFEPRLSHGEFDYNPTYAFADYSFNQAMELVDRYHPSLLWNDIGWPAKGLGDLPHLFAHYYNTVPDGAINDRWRCEWNDFSTAEYLTGTRSLTHKWEMCRGLGLSFGFNQNEGEETVVSAKELVRLLCEFVSHGGNLLINIGPRADGTIPEIQASRLRALGAWLRVHGEAIYGTRVWMEKQQETLSGGAEVYYTRTARDLFAIVAGLPDGVQQVWLPVCEAPQQVLVQDGMPVHIRFADYFGV